jgi:hypothetical protein
VILCRLPNIIFANALENEVKNEIGLKFAQLLVSPFLYTVVTIEYFVREGNLANTALLKY